MTRRLRSLLAVVLLGVALVCGFSQQASAAPRPRLLVVAMPYGAAEDVLSAGFPALGLGVFPESRDPVAFIREIGLGEPRGRGSASELAGSPGRLGRALAAVGVDVAVSDAGPRALVNALAFALGSNPTRPPVMSTAAALGAGITGLVVSSPADLDRLIPPSDSGRSGMIVLGVSGQTPVLVGVLGVGGRTMEGSVQGGWLLTNGLARRPGIVTPYDVAAMILTTAGAALPKGVELPIHGGPALRVPGGGFIGSPMRYDAPSDPTQTSALPEVRAIEDRLVRDARSGPALAQITTGLALGMIVMSGVLWLFRRRSLAIRAGQGAWFALAGYMGALFLSNSRAEVRAIPVVAALLIGAAIPTGRAGRVFACLAFGAAIAAAALAAIASLRPGGEPALSLWGDPLISWRFFGLQNGQAAFLAAGVLVWGVLAGLGAAALAVVALLAALVIGAPHIGANFVAVLTFVFGSSLAVCGLARRRIEAWHIPVSGVAATGAFVLALLADAGSPVSHGGRAARRISEGGISTAVGFVRARLDLNIHLIRGTFGGFIWATAVLAAGVALVVWGSRSSRQHVAGGVAVWAGAMMALASLVLEDSGFYSGATLMLAVPTAWMITAVLSPPPSLQHADDG